MLLLFSHVSFGAHCPLIMFVSNVTFVQTDQDQSVALDVDLFKFGSSCKKFKLGITTGDANNYNRRVYSGTDSIRYNFHPSDNTSTILKDVGVGNKKSNVKVDFKNGFYKRITVYAKLPNAYASGNPDPGQYSDIVTVNVEPDGNNTGGATKNISVFLNIFSDLSISLVDKGQPFEEGRTNYALMYGTMVQGQTKGLSLIIKANSGYRVSVSSENDGALTHINSPSYKVNYSFIVNGQGRSLVGSKNNPTEIFYSPVASGNNGDVVDIDVSIGNVDNKLAGPYQDYIYFNAISTN